MKRIYTIFLLISLMFTCACATDAERDDTEFSTLRQNFISDVTIGVNDTSAYFNLSLDELTDILNSVNNTINGANLMSVDAWVQIGEEQHTEADIPFCNYIYRTDTRAYLMPAIIASVASGEKQTVLKVRVTMSNESRTDSSYDEFVTFATICTTALYDKLSPETNTRHALLLCENPYYTDLSQHEQQYYIADNIYSTSFLYNGMQVIDFVPITEAQIENSTQHFSKIINEH